MRPVTRNQLKTAVEKNQWDLLDKLLEIDSTHIDDKSMFTDTWGEWWGMLFECVGKNKVTGVKILLKHGAKRKLGNWGDCLPMTPLELARSQENQELVELLVTKKRPDYQRKTDPTLPELTQADALMEKQERVAQETGLRFQVEALEEPGT